MKNKSENPDDLKVLSSPVIQKIVFAKKRYTF